MKDELTPTEDLQFTEALKQFLLSNKRNDEGIQIFVQSITIDYVIGKQNISNSIVYIHDKVDKDCTLMLSESVKHRLEEVEGATVRVSVQGTVVHSTQLQNEFSFGEFISYPLQTNFESFVLDLKELGLLGNSRISTLDINGASTSDTTSQYTPYLWLLLAITIALVVGTICMIIISRRRRRNYSKKTLNRWKDHMKSVDLEKGPFHINIDTSASVGSSNISSLELNSFESLKHHI